MSLALALPGPIIMPLNWKRRETASESQLRIQLENFKLSCAFKFLSISRLGSSCGLRVGLEGVPLGALGVPVNTATELDGDEIMMGADSQCT